jgi:hypothetical protein
MRNGKRKFSKQNAKAKNHYDGVNMDKNCDHKPAALPKDMWEDCPNCPNQGWYPITVTRGGYSYATREMAMDAGMPEIEGTRIGEPYQEQEQEQCEFCWTNPRSVYYQERVSKMENPNQNINLTDTEMRIIRRYQKHLWRIAKISLTQRKVLARILAEYDEELDMIERDLKAESRRQSS